MGTSASMPADLEKCSSSTQIDRRFSAPAAWIVCGGLEKKDKDKLCKHWQSISNNRRKMMIKTAFRVIFKEKPDLVCGPSSSKGPDESCCSEAKREMAEERHSERAMEFFDKIMEHILKDECENAFQAIAVVGSAHAKFSVRFDAEYWLVYKRALLEQICINCSAGKKMLWNRFLTLLLREMRAAYHEEILKMYSESGLEERRVTW